MANAYTAFLNLTKPEEGADRDTWGKHWNENADALDVWAKATDLLVKRGIVKDPDGGAKQTIAGQLAVASDLLIKKGNAFYLDHLAGAPGGYLVSLASGASTDLVPQANVFRVVDQAYTVEILKATVNGAFRNGQLIWDAGNLNPGLYVRNDVAGRQDLAGAIAFPNYLDIVRSGVFRARWLVDGGGTSILQDGDSGDYKFYVTSGGSAWFKEFGGLNSRIETRAANFADDRLAQAKVYTQGYVPQVAVTFGNGAVQGIAGPFVATNYLDIVRGGVFRFRTSVDPDGYIRFINGDNSQLLFAANIATGGMVLREIGDVNTRIENRAQAFADDRLVTATARINNKSARLAFVADAGTRGTTVIEDYGGCVITGYSCNAAGYVTGFRYRQLQMSDSNGNYYACAYV